MVFRRNEDGLELGRSGYLLDVVCIIEAIAGVTKGNHVCIVTAPYFDLGIEDLNKETTILLSVRSRLTVFHG